MPLPPPPRPEGHRSFAWLSGAAAFGIALGLSIVASQTDGDPPHPVSIRCYGREVPPAHDPSETVLDWTRQRFAGWLNLRAPDGEQHRLRYADLGVELDRVRWRELVRDAPSSGRVRRARGLDRDDIIDLPIPLRIDRERAWAALIALKDEVDRAPRDARIDVDQKAVVSALPGRLLDLDRSLAAIESSLERGDEYVDLAFAATQPTRSSGELAEVRYDVLLGAYETSSIAAPRDEGHLHDLALAASRLDGQVLMPGTVVDFNALVGPRDEANGYRAAKAPAELEAEPLDGPGGAMCQLSGTLYAAASFAGLEVVERHAEPRPSAYLELGLDAAIAYPALNLRLQNPYDFPVVLRETVTGGHVRAEVRGARRPYAVTIVRRIDRATPFPRLEHPDDTLPLGERVLAQRGTPGIELHRYQIRRDGAHAVRQVLVDHHAPTPQVTRVGTGLALSTAPTAFTTGRPPQNLPSEYLADELLVVIQSERLDGRLSEQRVRGRFGEPGWTKDIGAPAWISPP